jgi:omega-3 fatty acid desaturase (delta-15 desaturase)
MSLDLDNSANLSKIKDAIPPKCLEKNLGLSLYYLARDLAIIAGLYLIKDFFVHNWLLYLVWINVVGFFGWCLFVVGHDCGHGSFCDSYWLNQIFGHIAHAPLLVPFNGWKISHHHHHLNHNHTENDHGWKYVSAEVYHDMMSEFRSQIRFVPWLQLLMYHFYLVGAPDSALFSGSHFNPWSRLFAPHQRGEAAASTLACAAWLFFLLKTFSLSSLALYYFPPVLIFAAWLALVTYLHHTHPDSKYYDGSTWNYLKGAMTTIDRSYGSIIDYFHHNIETHVVHHLFFTAIPHYHLKEATKVVAPLLGKHYHYDPNPFWKTYHETASTCPYGTETSTKGVHAYPKKSQ